MDRYIPPTCAKCAGPGEARAAADARHVSMLAWATSESPFLSREHVSMRAWLTWGKERFAANRTKIRRERRVDRHEARGAAERPTCAHVSEASRLRSK